MTDSALLDALETAFPDVREVMVPGFDKPFPMRKPSYEEVLKARIPLMRALEDARKQAPDDEKAKELPLEEREEWNRKLAEAARKANVDLVRACVVGGFRAEGKSWSDERVQDLIERTARPGKDSPLVEAASRLAGLRESEVGGEDDPFLSPRATDGA